MKKIVLSALAAALVYALPAFASTTIGSYWSVNHTPAVNTQATATRAASADARHVATSCSGSISTVAAQPNITLSLRDGTTGAGTVLWSLTIVCAISSPCSLATPPGYTAPGTKGNAMTCEWSGIPAVGNFEVATLSGYDP